MPGTANKDRISIDVDLASVWSKVVKSGKIANEFNAPHSDLDGRWKSGDRILFGVTQSDHEFCYFAKNLSTDKFINANVEEKEVIGTEFRCQFNGYRALRPGGQALTIGRQDEISPNPIECRFYCQDPTNTLSLLHRTPLSQIRLGNNLWNAYYNAAPLEIEGHFILVPVQVSGARFTLAHHLQTLTREFIEDIFLLRDRSKNFVLLFNSLHAGASVNHIHVHAVYRRQPLAVEKELTNAGGPFYLLDTYPAEVLVFQGIQAVDLVSEHVMRFQEIGIPFNLIWVGERVFLVPRNIEHEVTEEFPFDTLSALDICGKIVTTDRTTYNSVSKELIHAALRKSSIPASKFLRN